MALLFHAGGTPTLPSIAALKGARASCPLEPGRLRHLITLGAPKSPSAQSRDGSATFSAEKRARISCLCGSARRLALPPSDQTNATAGGLIDPAVLYGRTYRTAACIAHNTLIHEKLVALGKLPELLSRVPHPNLLTLLPGTIISFFTLFSFD
jgi:hypothetical protein